MAVKDFVEIDPRQVRKSTEIVEKPTPVLEHIEKEGTRNERAGERNHEKESKAKEKGGKSKEGYVLIVTEKPQAALKIASALGKPVKHVEKGVPYYELERDGKRVIVAAAVGHLFTLDEKQKSREWPVFELEWKPAFLNKRSAFTKRYYDVLAKLCKNADSFIIATDYDIEGEVIGLNILRFIAKQQDAKRMKFSTLTKEELEKAYEEVRQTIDWGQALAGEARHYLDWLYGINLSRALMNAIRKAGRFKIMSIGRVQGPALYLVVERELAIRNFKPEPYWQIYILTDKTGKLLLKYPKDIKEKQELEKFRALKGKTCELKTVKREQAIKPPVPFDLTTLQTEAYKFYKITPARVLQIAQQLYLAGLISYPRTSSQKLPASIQARKILEKLAKLFSFVKHATRSKPVEGKKSDPAHPAIYPTGETEGLEKLSKDEEKIYELIVRRFVACFSPDAIVEQKKLVADVGGLKFTATGVCVKEKGWINVYATTLQEKELPDVEGKAKVTDVKIEEKETQPPKRYTPASLVRELAKRNLGTKATRAMIVETLYDRGYIEGQQIHATELGIKLVSALKKHSPIIIDENLTRNFEEKMEAIQLARHGREKQQEVIAEAKNIIAKISEQFRKKEEEIGKELLSSLEEMNKREREESKLIQCPVCGTGQLRLIYSKKTKRYFVACDSYPECKTTFTLPRGMVKKADKECEKCGWPMLMLVKRGKRPWYFCFNPACDSRKNSNEMSNNVGEIHG